MAGNPNGLPFSEFFCTPPVQQVVKKRLFRGPYITAEAYLAVCGYLYENGALLGRAMRDKALLFEQILGRPVEPGKLIGILQKQAEKRRSEYEGDLTSFFAFTARTELHRSGLRYPPAPEELNVKLAFNERWELIQMLFLEGIGFGLKWPDETEHMYRTARDIGPEWAEARKAGLSLPEKPDHISLQEQEQMVLQLTGLFTNQHYPHLVRQLGF